MAGLLLYAFRKERSALLRITTVAGSPGPLEVTLKIEGEIEAEAGALLETQCLSRIDEGLAVTLDLCLVTCVDSQGLEALRRLKRGGVRFIDCSPLIVDLLELLRPPNIS